MVIKGKGKNKNQEVESFSFLIGKEQKKMKVFENASIPNTLMWEAGKLEFGFD